jgi:transposase-like protein
VDQCHGRGKLWLQILAEIRNRGMADILIACVDD